MELVTCFNLRNLRVTDAGEVKGVSVITEGEAKGHEMWIDQRTLETVQAAARSKTSGVKVKLDHESGFGGIVGRMTNFRIQGKQLKADLQLLKDNAAFNQILEVIRELPEEVGMSISFNCYAQKLEEKRYARCRELYSVDFVDVPAANPNGLFNMKNEKINFAIATLNALLDEHATEDRSREDLITELAEASGAKPEHITKALEAEEGEIAFTQEEVDSFAEILGVEPEELSDQAEEVQEDKGKKAKSKALQSESSSVDRLISFFTGLVSKTEPQCKCPKCVVTREELTSARARITELEGNLAESKDEVQALEGKVEQLNRRSGKRVKTVRELGRLFARQELSKLGIDPVKGEDKKKEGGDIEDIFVRYKALPPAARHEFYLKHRDRFLSAVKFPKPPEAN